ncbi:MAG TPA: tetratricopeptide repeat protein [Acidobacteriaceae bacterium]|nr:tetratricopeptide repeat protein [Acidobacteriaceae bacterium]
MILWLGIDCKVRAGTEIQTAADARKAYSDHIASTYNFRYGKDQPFLPSNMQTDNGQFINPASFPTAQYCGRCHREAQHQWRESAHSNANRVPWYLRNVGLLNAEKGIEFSRHCEGCHDPIALATGALTQAGPKKRPYDQDGVTCTVCHSIQTVDTRGTGSYVLGVPAVMVDEEGNPVRHAVTDAEILAHLDRHSKAVMKPFYRTSEFCSACHKAALPRILNDYKWQRAISLYDEWQNSSFAKQSPLPFYRKADVSTCQTCHMTREKLERVDYGAKNGTLASHRWVGANTLIPLYYKYDEQAQRVADFLRNAVFNVDIFGIQILGASSDDASGMIAPLGLREFTLAPRQKVIVAVVLQNKGAAHSHVPEQRDMYESWVAFTLQDESGKIVAQSGNLRPDGELDPQAHSFTNRLIDKTGSLNALHEVWNNRVVAYNNTVQSGRSQIVRYGFTMPASGHVIVTATVRYRRFDQHFVDFGLDTKHFLQPVVNMTSQSRIMYVGQNAASKPQPAENPEWMRWNNYGIALLDAQQYAGSVRAFEVVSKLRPDYIDAYTNIAIVNIQWERFDDARATLDKALKLDPSDARALYYHALVRRNDGALDDAISDLKKVVAAYPRSRDGHRELGFSYYQRRDYALACQEYETLQSIDPDDLAAHYILAIAYRRLGMMDRSKRESAAFADQKDDPTASTVALEFLRKHRDIAQESVVWHVHDLDRNAIDEGSQPAPTGQAPAQQELN